MRAGSECSCKAELVELRDARRRQGFTDAVAFLRERRNRGNAPAALRKGERGGGRGNPTADDRDIDVDRSRRYGGVSP